MVIIRRGSSSKPSVLYVKLKYSLLLTIYTIRKICPDKQLLESTVKPLQNNLVLTSLKTAYETSEHSELIFNVTQFATITSILPIICKQGN